MKHFLLIYNYIPDVLEKRGPFREEHLAYVGKAREAGLLVFGAVFEDDPRGAALVFRTDDKAYVENFARNDPYMKHGIMTSFRVNEWAIPPDSFSPKK